MEQSEKQYLLGIDLGTSACKAAVFDRKGTVLASEMGEYEVYYPQPGWAEQNPEEWWQTVCAVLKRLFAAGTVSPEEIAGIGIDGQSWSAVAVDAEGRVLTNTPIWMDTRTEQLCCELKSRVGRYYREKYGTEGTQGGKSFEEKREETLWDRLRRELGEDPEALSDEALGDQLIFLLAGNSLQPSYTTAKLLWYQRNQPEVYEKTDRILQSNSFLAYRLTGIAAQDLSQGYGLHCFDMRRNCWDAEMCEALGISMQLLPPLVPCHQILGGVTEEAAAATGLVPGTPVAAGGLDAACGTLGVGVIHPGETQEQGGQAGGMSICMDRVLADPRLILGAHVVPGTWLLQGGTTGGGGVMRWLERELGDYERIEGRTLGKSSLELLNEEAAQAAAGSDGLVFLPYMAGERSPIWNPQAKGVYYGLDFKTSKGHLIRAAMEGVAYSLKHNLEVAEETAERMSAQGEQPKSGRLVTQLRAMGGSANSLLWTQIKSDVTGLPIVVPASDTATTLGAAILAGVGVGLYENFEEAVRMTVRSRRYHVPNPEHRLVYERGYQTYLELYKRLEPLMNQMGSEQ